MIRTNPHLLLHLPPGAWRGAGRRNALEPQVMRFPGAPAARSIRSAVLSLGGWAPGRVGLGLFPAVCHMLGVCASVAAGKVPAGGPRARQVGAPGAPGGGGKSGGSAGPPESHRFASARRAGPAAVLDRRESTLRHPLAAEPRLGEGGVHLGGWEPGRAEREVVRAETVVLTLPGASESPAELAGTSCPTSAPEFLIW